MSIHPLVHGSFTIERRYEASATQVFAAWADPEVKALWFIGPPGWSVVRRELDFRVGGSEVLQGRLPSGMETSFTARYHDIVPDQRMVYDYDMHLNGQFHSVSLATVEIRAEGDAARLIFNEQVVFLDGTKDSSSREHGTAAHLDRMRNFIR